MTGSEDLRHLRDWLDVKGALRPVQLAPIPSGRRAHLENLARRIWCDEGDRRVRRHVAAAHRHAFHAACPRAPGPCRDHGSHAPVTNAAREVRDRDVRRLTIREGVALYVALLRRRDRIDRSRDLAPCAISGSREDHQACERDKNLKPFRHGFTPPTRRGYRTLVGRKSLQLRARLRHVAREGSSRGRNDFE